jgi:pyruvate dehydrogenase (quinone)
MHLINGLYDCPRSRVPVLAIAAQVPSQEIGSGYFQETHPEHLFKDCSYYCELVSQADQMPRMLGIAMRTAIANRGVAVIVIPGDVLARDCAAPALALGIHDSASVVRPSDKELNQAAELLNGAQKVAILGGAGCEGAHDGLVALAARLKAPIVHALRGKEFIEYDNPSDVGMTGLLGFSSGYHAMMNCDALLMLGTDFPYPQLFPKKAKILQAARFLHSWVHGKCLAPSYTCASLSSGQAGYQPLWRWRCGYAPGRGIDAPPTQAAGEARRVQ